MTTAQVTWIGPGLRLVGEADESGHAIVLDHVLPGQEGHETGLRPMELLLVSLGGCTTMDVVSILQKKRQNVSQVQARISGERAETHPKVYTTIHIEYIVRGKDVDPRAVERSIELSQTKYCPASAMLGKTAEITTSYQIIEE